MPTATATGQCPRWCTGAHVSGAPGIAFYHASEPASVPVSRLGGAHGPDRIDVQAAQYLPDEPTEPAWSPAIEIAVHADGRYRLIGLTPDEARTLATLLTRAADLLTPPGPGDRPRPASAERREPR
jgi:hypothetical protein